jgi:hypothetical protein
LALKLFRKTTIIPRNFPDSDFELFASHSTVMAPTSDHPSSHRKLSNGAIAGLVVGACFIAAFCVLGVWLGLRAIRKREEREPPSRQASAAEDGGPVTRITHCPTHREPRRAAPHTMTMRAFEKAASPALASPTVIDLDTLSPTSPRFPRYPAGRESPITSEKIRPSIILLDNEGGRRSPGGRMSGRSSPAFPNPMPQIVEAEC